MVSSLCSQYSEYSKWWIKVLSKLPLHHFLCSTLPNFSHGLTVVTPFTKAWFPYMCQQDTQRRAMYGHQLSQTIPPFAAKACEVATKSHMLNFCEACAAICCDCDLQKPTTRETKKIFCPKKKSESKNKKNNDDFRKVVISEKKCQKKIISVLQKKEQSQNKNNDDFQNVVICD